MLTERALNRALLARQMLLTRARVPIERAVQHLIGLQAQKPDPPHIGLWTRVAGVRYSEIDELLEQRRLVRVAAMRSTIHLLTADDGVRLRPVIQPVLDRELRAQTFRSLRWVDISSAASRGRQMCETRPLSFADLGQALAAEFPRADPHALAIAVRNNCALVQIPPRGKWRTPAPTVHVPVSNWLGRPEHTASDPGPLVLRYLAAFGPATSPDIARWCGLQGMKLVLERLRNELRWFTDDRGRTLADIADGILPDPDTPAPVRFLPEYDNALLSHSDRTRIIADGDRPAVFTRNGQVEGTVLVDGYVGATWRSVVREESETVSVRPLRRLSKGALADIEREALCLLDFASSGKEHRVEFRES